MDKEGTALVRQRPQTGQHRSEHSLLVIGIDHSADLQRRNSLTNISGTVARHNKNVVDTTGSIDIMKPKEMDFSVRSKIWIEDYRGKVIS